jgi:hypothetical protein
VPPVVSLCQSAGCGALVLPVAASARPSVRHVPDEAGCSRHAAYTSPPGVGDVWDMHTRAVQPPAAWNHVGHQYHAMRRKCGYGLLGVDHCRELRA